MTNVFLAFLVMNVCHIGLIQWIRFVRNEKHIIISKPFWNPIVIGFLLAIGFCYLFLLIEFVEWINKYIH